MYSEIFGKENIIVLPFEMLKEQPSNFLHTLEQEFSIPHFDFKIKKINASLPIQTIPTLIKISTVINKMITWLPKNIQLKTAYTYAFFLHFVKEHLLVRLKNKSKNEVLEDKGAVQKLLPIFHANTQNICKEKHITMYAHLYK